MALGSLISHGFANKVWQVVFGGWHKTSINPTTYAQLTAGRFNLPSESVTLIVAQTPAMLTRQSENREVRTRQIDGLRRRRNSR
jgi:hypothetical protein